MQFYPPPKAAFTAVRKARLSLANAPNNSLPQGILQNFKECGFPVQARALAPAARAAMYRTAVMSATLDHANSVIESDDDDSIVFW
eukprot:1852724-Pyramimonas_sp.AAC.1